MGFFSWDCKVCGHPMLSHYALEDKNAWMNDVVVLESDGSILRGEYGGYGDVGEHEINIDSRNEPECYHEHCWELAGRPTEYTTGSRSARDQGYFCPDNYHNIDPPTEMPTELAESYSMFDSEEEKERKIKKASEQE